MLNICTESDLVAAGELVKDVINFHPGVFLKLSDVIETSYPLRFMGDATIVRDKLAGPQAGLKLLGNANIRSTNYIDAITCDGIVLSAEKGLFSLLKNSLNTLNLLHCDIDCNEMGYVDINQLNIFGGNILNEDMLPLQCRDLSGFMISHLMVKSKRPVIDISQVPILRGLGVVTETVFKHQTSGAAIISRQGGNNHSKTRGKMGPLIRPHSLVSLGNVGLQPWEVFKNIDGSDIQALPTPIPRLLALSYLV